MNSVALFQKTLNYLQSNCKREKKIIYFKGTLFHRHAKRTTVNTDDVLLMCRRNPSLLKLMREETEKLKTLKEQGKEKPVPGEKRKGGRVKKKELPIILDDDDEDD